MPVYNPLLGKDHNLKPSSNKSITSKNENTRKKAEKVLDQAKIFSSQHPPIIGIDDAINTLENQQEQKNEKKFAQLKQ